MVVKKVLKSFSVLATAGVLLSSVAFATTGTVTGNSVRIRKEADSKSIEVSVAKKGEKVEVIGEKENWYQVKFENVTGYISKEYVDTEFSSQGTTNNQTNSSETPTPEPVQTPTPPTSEVPQETPTEQPASNTESTSNNTVATVDTKKYEKNQTIKFESEASLRYLPSFTSRVQAKIEKDSTYTVQASLNNWVKVSNDNNSGWVLKTSIEGEIKEPEKAPDESQEQTPQTSEAPQETPTEQSASTPNETPQPAEPAPEDTSFKGTVNVKSAVLRRSPNGEKIDSLPQGTVVTVLSEENDWYKIKTDDYDGCYVAKRLITKK